jgi:hypothetical protein
MGNRWQLTDGPRPFALTKALEKLEVPPGSPITFRQLTEPATGRTCMELIAIERLPAGVNLSSAETVRSMLNHVGVPAPDEHVSDPDHKVRLICVSRDGAAPTPVAVVVYAD